LHHVFLDDVVPALRKVSRLAKLAKIMIGFGIYVLVSRVPNRMMKGLV
jgi:hypothetical protein